MDKQQDFFVPSAEIAQRINALHDRQSPLGGRLDVTPTKAPSSVLEPVSVPRLQESISIRLQRLMGGMGRRALHEDRESVAITTGTKLAPNIAIELAQDLGIRNNGSFEALSTEMARELQAWLSAYPGGTKEYGFGTIGFNEDEEIVFIPTPLAEFKEGPEPEVKKNTPIGRCH